MGLGEHRGTPPPRWNSRGQVYGGSREFLEACKRRLAGDTAHGGATGEVKELRREASALREVVADLTLESRPLKKHKRDGENEA